MYTYQDAYVGNVWVRSEGCVMAIAGKEGCHSGESVDMRCSISSGDKCRYLGGIRESLMKRTTIGNESVGG